MNFCGNCGTHLEGDPHFCPNCGAPTAPNAQSAPRPSAAPTVKTCGYAVAGFVLGLCALLFGWICCLNILGVLGFAFSVIALCRIADSHEGGKGLAIAGLVLSILSLLFLVVLALASQSALVIGDSALWDMYDDILSWI